MKTRERFRYVRKLLLVFGPDFLVVHVLILHIIIQPRNNYHYNYLCQVNRVNGSGGSRKNILGA